MTIRDMLQGDNAYVCTCALGITEGDDSQAVGGWYEININNDIVEMEAFVCLFLHMTHKPIKD